MNTAYKLEFIQQQDNGLMRIDYSEEDLTYRVTIYSDITGAVVAELIATSHTEALRLYTNWLYNLLRSSI